VESIGTNNQINMVGSQRLIQIGQNILTKEVTLNVQNLSQSPNMPISQNNQISLSHKDLDDRINTLINMFLEQFYQIALNNSSAEAEGRVTQALQ
jgi:hypothetical protein